MKSSRAAIGHKSDQTAAPPLAIEVADEQHCLAIDPERLRAAVRAVFDGESVRGGEVSLAIVDDETIHAINRRYLNHDEPTDVISFVLEHRTDRLMGEIVASAETAAREAPRFGWSPHDELVLYVIHGALHLVGYDDLSEQARPTMRERERHYLALFGLTLGDGVATNQFGGERS